MQHALKYKEGMGEIVMRIRDGEIHQYDLVNCQGKERGFILSVGIELSYLIDLYMVNFQRKGILET